MTLTLSSRQKSDCVKTRFQDRTINSTRLGRINVRYQAGITVDDDEIRPAELKQFAPCRSRFAYDTIFLVTELRYRHLMQREEIQHRLAIQSGFTISTGSVSNLSWMGLAYLEHCHFAHSKELAACYRRTCFFIHLDGTNEGGKYNHFVVREGMSGNVLYADKIISESEFSIVPILNKVKDSFGEPEAVISDMSAAIRKAVKTVFKRVPHLLCHFHFLKDIGKDMLQDLHQPLKYSVKGLRSELKELRAEFDAERNRLAGNKSPRQIKRAEDYAWLISMIDRINDYEKDLSGEGFPFDLAHLAFSERCQEVSTAMMVVMTEKSNSRSSDENHRRFNWAFSGLANRLQNFQDRLNGSIRQLQKVNAIFLQLREILHPKTEKDGAPLNWGMLQDRTSVENMETKLIEFGKKAEKKVKATYLPKYEWKAWKIIHQHLKKHGKQLNPEITVNDKKVILPRTNNLSETGFREIKRKARRTTGKKNLSRYMDDLPAQYSYITNLDDPDYITAVFRDKQIHEHFQSIDKNEIRKTTDKMKAQRGSPKAIDYRLIRNENYIKLLVERFANTG